MSTTPKPQHNAPACPGCGATVVTPFAKREAYDGRPPEADCNLMCCPACGDVWVEEDPVRIAHAWWSAGAHEGAEAGDDLCPHCGVSSMPHEPDQCEYWKAKNESAQGGGA